MWIEHLNGMSSEARQNIFENFCVIWVKKGVIWASEYNLGLQKWGVRGLGPGAPWIPYWITGRTNTKFIALTPDCMSFIAGCVQVYYSSGFFEKCIKPKLSFSQTPTSCLPTKDLKFTLTFEGPWCLYHLDLVYDPDLINSYNKEHKAKLRSK